MEGIRISVRDKRGKEIGAFYYNQSRIATPKAYAECGVKLNRKLVPLAHISITPEGRAATGSGKKVIRNAEKAVYELFDTVLGYKGASRAFFDEVRPFANVGGKFYCEQCLQAVGQYIQSQGEKQYGKRSN